MCIKIPVVLYLACICLTGKQHSSTFSRLVSQVRGLKTRLRQEVVPEGDLAEGSQHTGKEGAVVSSVEDSVNAVSHQYPLGGFQLNCTVLTYREEQGSISVFTYFLIITNPCHGSYRNVHYVYRPLVPT